MTKMNKCHRNKEGYCRYYDTSCQFQGREYGCAIYRHDAIEENLEEQAKRYVSLFQRQLSVEDEGERNE